MSLFYLIGPSILAFISALVIATYSWKYSKLVSGIVLFWVMLAIIVGRISFFHDSANWQSGDWAGFMIFGMLSFSPAIFLVLASRYSSKFKLFLSDIPIFAIVLSQFYRVGGIFLFIAYIRGLLPLSIGLISGVLDIFVAISSVFLGVYLRNNQYKAPKLVIAWATISLLDFVWAVLVIFMSFLGIVSINPAPIQMGNPPLLVISLFAMPLSIFVSIYIIEYTLKNMNLKE